MGVRFRARDSEMARAAGSEGNVRAEKWSSWGPMGAGRALRFWYESCLGYPAWILRERAQRILCLCR